MAPMEQSLSLQKIFTRWAGEGKQQTTQTQTQESLTFLSKTSNILGVAKKTNPDLLFVTQLRYAIKYFVYYWPYWWVLSAVTFDKVKWWKMLRVNSVNGGDIAGLDHKFWTFVHVNMTSDQSHCLSFND